MDRGAWKAAGHGVVESDTNEHTTHTCIINTIQRLHFLFDIIFLLPGVNLCFIWVTFLIYLPWGYPQSIPQFCKLLYSVNISGVLSVSSSSRGPPCSPQLTPVEISGSLVPVHVWLLCCPVSGIWCLFFFLLVYAIILHSSPLSWKRHLFGVLVLEGLVSLCRAIQLQLLRHYWSGHRLGLLWYWMVCPGNEQRSFCHFWDCTQVLHFRLLLTMRATPFLPRDSCPQ